MTTKYKTLKEAKIACFLDKDCSTIYNYKCDGRYFYLCKKESIIKPSAGSTGSCVYSRPIEAGNKIYQAIQNIDFARNIIPVSLNYLIFIRSNTKPQRN